MSRRMFSTEITMSDAFLDMPATAQLLYFHIGMNADDDGFISSPKMVMRVLGSSANDYDILVAKKFLLSFESGVCVIKHWRINNQIRKDRYTETKYVKEKLQLFYRENGGYSLNSKDALPVPKGHFAPSGNQLATIGQPSIGKVSIGKVSIDTEVDLPEWLNKEVWAEWVDFRKEKKQALKSTTVRYQLKFLEKYKDQHVEIIQKSLQQGWTGLFEPKGAANNSKPNNVLATKHSKTLAEKMAENAAKNK